MKSFLLGIVMLGVGTSAFADPLTCDMTQYKASSGLTASVERDELVVSWEGAAGSELRARYGIERAQPIVRELAVRKRGGQWAVLGQNLMPEFKVQTGRRRVAFSQLSSLKELGIEITPEILEREAWFAFWDAPFVVPGVQEGQSPMNPDLPRKPEEIRRAMATFKTSTCEVKTDGGRVEVTFPGLSMGIFAGSARFTVYRGTNLIRLEAIAKTEENLVAYKYDGGLKGFATATLPKVTWRDTGGNAQQYEFGGGVHDGPVTVRAKNRVMIAEGRGGSVAVFPPPTVFFHTREVDTNLGYVWYRKDAAAQYSIGVKQADREDDQRYLLSARVRGGRVGRRPHGRPSDHQGDRAAAVRHEEVLDPVRCDREEMGAAGRVGFGRQWRVRAARLAEPRHHDDDGGTVDSASGYGLQAPGSRRFRAPEARSLVPGA